MQIKNIHSFLELYKIGNISKTSEALYITQQGLSRQIKALEEELGITLFIRKKDGVVPTDICHELIPSFTSMYESYTEALRTIHAEKQFRLRIGFAYGISHGLNNDFLIAYQKAFPNVSLEIQEWTVPTCQEMLLKGKLDFAVLIAPFDKADLECRVLCEGAMYAAMHKSHPLAAEDGPLPFAALANEQIITGSSDNALRRFFDHCCKLTKIHPPVLMSSAYHVDFVNSMEYNAGISTMTSAMAARITNPDICIRRLILPVPGHLYLCSAKQPHLQNARKHFADFSTEYFRLHPIVCPGSFHPTLQ